MSRMECNLTSTLGEGSIADNEAFFLLPYDGDDWDTMADCHPLHTSSLVCRGICPPTYSFFSFAFMDVVHIMHIGSLR